MGERQWHLVDGATRKVRNVLLRDEAHLRAYVGKPVFEIELNTAVSPSAVEAPAPDLWPNPATDLLNISMDRTFRTASVTIIDMNGHVVRSLANFAVQDRTLTIPVADLSDGLYTLRIGDGLKAQHQRFVVSR